jgi:hypothetical protein
MIEVRQTAGKAFVEKVQRLAGVTGVFLSSEGGTIHFWTVIGAQHKNIRRNVYECELAVMKQFPAFEYDFHLNQWASEGHRRTIAAGSPANLFEERSRCHPSKGARHRHGTMKLLYREFGHSGNSIYGLGGNRDFLCSLALYRGILGNTERALASTLLSRDPIQTLPSAQPNLQ